MNSYLTCFVVGLPLVALWLVGVRRGVMVGLVFGLVHREEMPSRFWPATLVYGVLAFGLVIMPSLYWFGLWP